MKNQNVGILILGVAALIGFIIISFNRALTAIVNSACSHGSSCPMWGAIDFQTNMSAGIMAFVIIIGFYLVFFGKETVATSVTHEEWEKIEKNYERTMKNLGDEEKLILEKIIEAQGAIFQSDLVNKLDFSKVKVTRILDRLEGRNLVERRRRGMSNVVILKH
ncbi:MAG: MarR family transcriptional regulator [Theionarchaea archaeon]|nr:MarR family transcriptional regulator [Theionarchaea archaeon]